MATTPRNSRSELAELDELDELAQVLAAAKSRWMPFVRPGCPPIHWSSVGVSGDFSFGTHGDCQATSSYSFSSKFRELPLIAFKPSPTLKLITMDGYIQILAIPNPSFGRFNRFSWCFSQELWSGKPQKYIIPNMTMNGFQTSSPNGQFLLGCTTVLLCFACFLVRPQFGNPPTTIQFWITFVLVHVVDGPLSRMTDHFFNGRFSRNKEGSLW